MDKRLHEEWVARAFCHSHALEFGTPSEFVRLVEPPAADTLIIVDGAEVCLELVRYREDGPYNRAFPLNAALLLAIFDASIDKPDLPRLTPTIQYREREPDHYTIPPKHEWPSFTEELFSLCRDVDSRAHDEVVRVALVRDEEIDLRWRLEPRVVFAPLSMYPCLGRYCKGLSLYRHPGLRFGFPRSSMNTRSTATDFESIQRVLDGKFANLRAYRAAAGEKLVWLLCYAEGFPPSARPVGMDVDQSVVSHIRDVASHHVEQFDAVWWANPIYAQRGPTLVKVV